MSSKGITKIEAIIVGFVIVILIVANIFIISYLNKKARDIHVLSEINQIRSGLEVFLLANNYYPRLEEATELNNSYYATEKLCLDGFQRIDNNCSKNILRPVPNKFLSRGNTYIYQSIDNNKDYNIEFILETNFRDLNLIKGKNCANNLQITSQPCF
jgi:hypothetical protein